MSNTMGFLDAVDILTDKWAELAYVIEQTHGANDPAASAFRICITDLKELVQEIEKAREAA